MSHLPFRRYTIFFVSVIFGTLMVLFFVLFVRHDTLAQEEAVSQKKMALFAFYWSAAQEKMRRRALVGVEFFGLSPQREKLGEILEHSARPLLVEKIQAIDPVLAKHLDYFGLMCIASEAKEALPKDAMVTSGCSPLSFAYRVHLQEGKLYAEFSPNEILKILKKEDEGFYGLMLHSETLGHEAPTLEQVDDFFLLDPEGVAEAFLHSQKTPAWQKAKKHLDTKEPAVFFGENALFLFLPLVVDEKVWGYFVKKESLTTPVGLEPYLGKAWALLALILLGMFTFGYVMWRKKERLEELATHLLRQKEQTEALIDQAEFGVAHLDMQGNFHYVSQKFASLLRADATKLVGKNIALFLGHQEALRIVKKVQEGQKIKTRHYFCNFDKKTIDLETFASLDPANTFIYYVAASRKEKTDLEHLLMRTSLYFNHSDLGHIIANEAFIVLECNETLERLSGHSRVELVGESMGKLFQTELLFQTWKRNYAKPLSMSTGNGFEYKLSHKSKGVFWVEMFGNTFSESGHKQYIFSIRDISVRINARNTIRRLNESLQRKYDELEGILEVMPLPIFIKDSAFRYSGCNAAFCDFFRINKEDLIGKKADELYLDAFAQKIQEKDEAMKSEDFQRYKNTAFLPGRGEERTLEFHKKALYKEGEFNGFIGVVVDITSKENEKRLLQEAIKAEVEKNIQILEQHQEEKIKDAKFSSIGKMAAGITHEINTPLTYIKGNVEMLRMDIERIKEEALRASMLKDTQTILEGLGRIANIIESMREASQKSNETPEVINLFETLVHALVLSHNRAKQIVAIELNDNPFDLLVSKEAHCFTCKVQKQRVEQVWIIILNNALDELVKIEAFGERKLSIWMRCEGDTIITTFKDNAGGIKEEMLKTLFDPFVSAKTSSGMGIGLNIAQRIIGEQNGEIRAYNDEQGAVFEVMLPLYEEDV